jgi:hypothetical protein
MHDPIVVSVILKEGFTKVKKRNLRQAIIFENNSFAYMTKEPINAGADTYSTS